MSSPPAKPDLADFLDYRAYLDAWFSWKKATNKRFSHRLFARLSGQSNPSLLLQIIQGKRNLTERTQESYIGALGLDPDDAQAFRLMVAFDQAPTPEARTEAFEALSASRRFRSARRIEGDSFRYLSRWYVVAARELALCPGFRADPHWLAATLRPGVSLDQAREALHLLFDLGMLVHNDDGGVEVRDTTLATPHEVYGLAAYNYHRAMLTRAMASMDEVDPAERHLGAITVAIPESMIPRFKAELTQLQERLLDLADESDRPDRVYQVALQTFPLSHPVGDSTEEPG